MIFKKAITNLPMLLNRLGLDIKNGYWWRDVLVIAVAYNAVSRLALIYHLIDKPAPLWPGAGFMVGFLLAWGRSRWFGVLLGTLFFNLIADKLYGRDQLYADNSLALFLPPLGASIGSTLGALITATLILWFTGTNYPFQKVRHVVNFVLCSLFTGAIFQANIGILSYWHHNYVIKNLQVSYGSQFWSWWTGDGIGNLIFAPLVITWLRSSRERKFHSWVPWEVIMAIVSLIVIWYLTLVKNQPIEYLFFPPLLWSAFRFGTRLTILLVVVVSQTASWMTLNKFGVFYQKFLESNSLLLLQLFMGVMAITTMAFLAVVAENNQAQLHLQKSNTELEQRVLERTRDLQESEAEARELAVKAEGANQAKSTFIANMSHELRTPLNAILGFSQLMLRKKDFPPEQYENMGIIYRNGEYLLTLINNLLDLSKIEAGATTLNQKEFDLHQLLDDLEDLFHLQIEKAGLELVVDREPHLPRYIYIDGIKLRQVLINLLNNAIKFTPQGSVNLRVRFKLNEDNQSYTLNFRVVDTGVGISPTELSKLFKAFTQTESGRSAQEGTGLGLVISRQFVQLMGGDITVESEVGKGTTLRFFVQADVVKETNITKDINENSPQVLALAPHQPTYKILTVDDKPINRQLLVKLLSPLGFEIREARNGQDAIELWETWQPHLIWMDIRMPIMDGYEATKYIKSQTENNFVSGKFPVIIALTAHVLEEEKAVVTAAGFDDFLRKPFIEKMIFDLLSQHLGVQYLYEESAANPLQETNLDDRTPAEIISSELELMGAEWRSRLSQATVEGDLEQMHQLILRIPPSASHLMKVLEKLTRQFEFDEIIKLLQPEKY